MSSQERRSSTSSSNNKSPLRASQQTAQDGHNNHRYSSPISSNSSTRYYATPEESDAVLPVFSTPTHMYLKQELNQRYTTPSPKQQYASSPAQTSYTTTQQQQKSYSATPSANGYVNTKPPDSPLAHARAAASNQYGRTRGESNPTRVNVDHFGMKSMKSEVNSLNSSSSGNQTFDRNKVNHQSVPNGGTSTPILTPQQDLLLAQLVDMGFTLEASRVAMIASGGTNLQEILDILVTDANLEKQTAANNSRRSQPPPLPRHGSNPSAATSNYSQGQPPSSPNYQQPAPPPRTKHQPAPTNYQPSPISTSDYNPTPNTQYNQPSQQNSSSKSDDEDEDPRLEREKEEAFKRQQEERRKEYLDQLKREKPTPPTPSPRPPPKSPSPPIFTDPATLLYAEKERKQGNYLFNKNQFPEAEAAYSLAINALPPGSSELVLLCNNRAAARLKQSKYQACLTDCAIAIDVARKQMMTSQDPTWKQQMIKALHRKASALEGLCLFEAAIQAYEEYVRLDGTRSAQVTKGIMRCQQAILDIKKGQQKQPPQQPPRPTSGGAFKPATNNENTAFPDIDFNMFIPQHQNTANLEEINKSKAVQEMRDREKKREAEETEKMLKEDQVNAQISVWKTGKDKNLRALLGSLELILWPGVQWKSVQMSDLLDPKRCKVTYMKAIAKVHPDKLPANATVEQKMLASGIFTTLNQAWDVFKAQNNL